MQTEPRYQELFAGYEQTPFVGVSEQTLGHEILALTPDPAGASDFEKAELFAFQFVENYREQNDNRGVFFKPHRAQPLADGTERVYPDINEVTEEMCNYWLYRAQVSQHPVIKARYAGLVHEFSMKIRGQRADHTISRMFATALLDSSMKELISVFMYRTGKLAKALSVAVSLNDATLAGSIKDGILQLERSVPSTETRNYWAFSFDLLLTPKKKIVSAEEEQQLIERLNQRFTHFLGSDSEAAWEASERLCKYYHSHNEPAKTGEILEKLENELRSSFNGQPVFQKVHILERLHKAYMQYGYGAKAVQLLVEIRSTARDSDKEMKSVSGSNTVSQADIDQMVNLALNFEGIQLFLTLAVQNSLNMQMIETAVNESVRENAFYHFLSKHLLDAKGRKIGILPPFRDNPAPYLIRQAEFFIKYNALFFRFIINEGIQRGVITTAELMKYIRLSTVFETGNLLIVERAVGYYFSGDYVGFIAVIIPQIEEAIRNLVEKSGGNILVIKDEVYMLRTFDHLLGDPIVVARLGEANCFHFKALLTEKTGMNLRNDVAHGYILPDKFDEQHADAVLSAVLILVLQTVANNES